MNSAMTMRMAKPAAPAPPGVSGREEAIHVGERLEFERVAERVEEEHRRLLAWLAAEAHVGLDHETDAGGAEPLRERLPGREVDDDAEMPDRHVLAVDEARRVGHVLRSHLVRDDLVAVEVEVHPVLGAPALRAAQEAAVEAARLVEVGHR